MPASTTEYNNQDDDEAVLRDISNALRLSVLPNTKNRQMQPETHFYEANENDSSIPFSKRDNSRINSTTRKDRADTVLSHHILENSIDEEEGIEITISDRNEHRDDQESLPSFGDLSAIIESGSFLGRNNTADNFVGHNSIVQADSNIEDEKSMNNEDWSKGLKVINNPKRSFFLDLSYVTFECDCLSPTCSMESEDATEDDSFRVFFRQNTITDDVSSSHSSQDEPSEECLENRTEMENSEHSHHSSSSDTHPFVILGTPSLDQRPIPQVLSQPLMESLQLFFPFSKGDSNFWMRYSLDRDGASMHTFLQHAHGARYSILAIETMDGELFGAFTSEPWRTTPGYYGNSESFLWRLKHSRLGKKKEKPFCQPLGVVDDENVAEKGCEIEVYPYLGENNMIQICNANAIAVGGGSPDVYSQDDANECTLQKKHHYGYGLYIQEDMQHGTTSPCVTFGSPSLSHKHSDGSIFEIKNMELWSLTPCILEEDAQKLERETERMFC